ncbi:putative hemolysin activator HlyB [Klebsiella pneumoniae]|uniref:Putative hemolysin activator HlyB n=1 Tax=Klebsiella pneumoniae TaxID=573 RepID=A0A4P0XYP9_KLEPN|nr:putative hemolysin activator HlyB [Klebsiella pneumoniae]
MLIRSRTLTGLLFITLAGTSAAGAAPLASSTHQTEQDKARQEALAPQQQDFQSSQQRVAPQGIPFPEETHCKLINRVDIDSDNQALTRKLLAKTATGRRRDAVWAAKAFACWPIPCKMS